MDSRALYVAKCAEQRARPPVEGSIYGGEPVELRFEEDGVPDGKWLWFKSKHAAGLWLFDVVLKTGYTQSKMHRLVQRGTMVRIFKGVIGGVWVARLARNMTPPGHRRNSWYWLRTVWLPTRSIYFFWLGETLKTTHADGGAGRKRDREEFEREFVKV